MATREVLAELAEMHGRKAGTRVAVESIGGVDAAKRIRAGEPFDFVVLADEAMGSLGSEGRLAGGTRVAFASSGVAVAVRAGSTPPVIASEADVRNAVLNASSIGYSTGPSGVHIARLFERWGVAEAIAPRLVQAPPGVAVGGLVASGKVSLGFQQLSELVHLAGIQVVGTLPREIQATTIFSGAICATSVQRDAASAWLAFIASPGCADVKRRHGMQAP